MYLETRGQVPMWSLTAEVLNQDGATAIADTNKSDSIVYTITKMNLSFVD